MSANYTVFVNRISSQFYQKDDWNCEGAKKIPIEVIIKTIKFLDGIKTNYDILNNIDVYPTINESIIIKYDKLCKVNIEIFKHKTKVTEL